MTKKRVIALFLALSLTAGLFAGCGKAASSSSAAVQQSSSQAAAGSWAYTDALGREVKIDTMPQRVVSLYGSFAECWMLAGGKVIGATDDAVKERDLDFDDDVTIVGTVKEPNLEQIIALTPDLVLLSADIAPQVQLDTALTESKIPHIYLQMDNYQTYLAVLRGFCDLTGREDLYAENGAEVEEEITEAIARAKAQPKHPTALLLRAFSSGVKAKAEDNLAGIILKDLGADNIASRHESLLEDLSMETIIAEDPDYIFVTIMGTDDEAAMKSIAESLGANPAWKELSAVKNDRFIVLPKELFHYKPNEKWGDSYEYLVDILYPNE